MNDLWSKQHYQLLDFGDGRKLERFGQLVLDRPSPAAIQSERAAPHLWSEADVKLELQHGEDVAWPTLPIDHSQWCARYEEVVFQLKPTPFGHVGLFPEHAVNWHWLSSGEQASTDAGPKQLLNLFAYTGGASLVMASRGWSVAHVDASAPSVAWARENARLSGLQDAKIRWLVDDAREFAERELRRGRVYDAIVLDPPTYGHGPKGKPWRIDRDLPGLLEVCCKLLRPEGRLVLTGHTQTSELPTLDLASIRRALGHPDSHDYSQRLSLIDLHGRALDCGWSIRSAPRNSSSHL